MHNDALWNNDHKIYKTEVVSIYTLFHVYALSMVYQNDARTCYRLGLYLLLYIYACGSVNIAPV